MVPREEHTIEISAEAPVKGAQAPIKTSFSLNSSERNVALLGDKAFNERTVHRQEGGDLQVRTAAFPYEEAKSFYEDTGGRPPRGTADISDAEATGLDDRIDDLIGEAEEALSKTSISASSEVDNGKRNLIVKVVYDGNEVLDFEADDIGDIDFDDVVSTGLDDDDEAEIVGAELILDNGGEHPARSRPRGVFAKWRATSNGENDRIDNENTNTLVQSKGGFIVISAADININAGINATLAIFIA